MGSPVVGRVHTINKMADFRQDPLIGYKAIAMPKQAEILVSDLLAEVAGYPLGTRPISEVTQTIDV